MGKIKYYFDSGENNVLIHDTNDKSKFKKDIRAYSHGCIRIAEPVKFGTTLVGLDRPNTADSVEIWVNTGQRKRYVFEEPIPLYVRYITCEANSKSHITFYPDIYGKDKELKKQLFASREI
jgi:murein L,D-transpeptidase YcbB/YkuD